jgi:hypothetical protein
MVERSDPRVRPDVLMAALLDEIAERLLRIEQRLSRIEELQAKPRGFIFPINLTVTEPTAIEPPFPLFSLTLFNDGPDDVFPGYPEQAETPLMAGESLVVNFNAPRIAKIFLFIQAGKTARVRGFGAY